MKKNKSIQKKEAAKLSNNTLKNNKIAPNMATVVGKVKRKKKNGKKSR